MTTNGIVCSGGCESEITACNFTDNPSGAINLNALGANTTVAVASCSYNGLNTTTSLPEGIGIQSTTGARIDPESCSLRNLALGIQCGTTGDTSTTEIHGSGTIIEDCTNDIVQVGTSTLNFLNGTFDNSKTTIADPTNVNIAAFNNGATLAIGTDNDIQHPLYEILNGEALSPTLIYQPNYYGNKGPIYQNQNSDATCAGVQAQSNTAAYYLVTGDNTQQAAINLISDTANFGSSDNVRGWNITKLGTSADLAFNYSNNDTSGQAARGSNSVIELDGFNNQVLFPTATNTPLPTNTTAKLVWAGDTDLYRASANTLQTDGNLIVSGVTANRALTTNNSSQLTASATTSTELGYLSGTTSSVQTQLNSKLSTTGGTLTGTLTLPAGSDATPSLQFSGSTNTGFSAATANTLSFNTLGTQRMSINNSGLVTINNLASTGVVHTDNTGLLSTSLIVNADVSSSAAITDNKLATISTAGKVANSATTATSANTANTIVARDASGNFSAGTITATLNGNASTATTATNFSGSLSGDVTGTQSATVVSTVGGQSAANVASATIAANAATSTNTASTIVKRDSSGNFAAGTITAALTGAASLNVLKAGDTMTGTLTHPAGNAASPSIQFTGSTNTGFSAATANTLSFDVNGVEQMSISAASIKAATTLIRTGVLCDQATQSVTATSSGSVTTNATTSMLLLINNNNVSNFTVNFPPSPINGQFFTILLAGTGSVAVNNVGGTGGASIVNPINTLSPGNPSATGNSTAVTYYYVSSTNSWYRYSRA